MGPSKKNNYGFAYVLAFLLLAIFSALAMAFTLTTDLDMQKSNNCRNSAEAQMAAEGGLAFMLNVLDGIRLPGNTTEETFCANLREALADRLDGTTNLDGEYVTNTSDSVLIPDIQIEGKSFCYWFNQLDSNRCQITVRGTFGGVTRYLSMDLMLVFKPAMAFDYGLASRGQISIFGNARILGVNDLT
ncbi:MAG: pilus assembly PilX N-terminal domain-containing protein, partial [Planctomycetota bacterium]|nr:pilus assembly PilX N-terminal domain-containing protein [Planctomycetota bacterium]